MKHNPIILMTLLLGLTLFGCKKQEQETLTPKIKNDKVETTATTATFTWTVDWPGKLISVVELSENEDMSNSQYYGSEAETDNHDFTVTASDLKVSTKYYYRHVVWNHFYSDNKFVMEGKSFTTKTDVPKVKTVEVTDVTRTTATVIGEVTDECGSEVTERGVCWGTSHNPTASGSHLNSGTGTGSYSIAISNLEVGKTYYVRAYAKNSNGTAYGEELEFVTGDAVKPTVTTAEVTNIDWRTATGGGEVTDDGDATVTERGICWSTSHNPEVSGDHASNGTGIGSYTVNMTGLTAGTVYYVRAYAKNMAGLSYGNEVSFNTLDVVAPMVNTLDISLLLQTSASCGCEVINDGGSSITEKGVCWSTSQNPTIENNHGIGSTVAMTGLTPNTKYYVRAYAKNHNKTGYGEEKSFTTLKMIEAPTGFIKGLFSVSQNKQVYFSQGNLQYQASTNTWRFATNQYDRIGSANINVSQNYSGWIDLFCWGTSGYNHGAVCYQPWSVSKNVSDYYAYGSYMYNLYNQTGKADWGYNAISNGGNQENLCRTLTINEWKYLLKIRSTSSGYRYAVATVNGVKGIILLPDDWNPSTYYLDKPDLNVAFATNYVQHEEWANLLEPAGAVFLPLTGERGYDFYGEFFVGFLDYGNYYSSSTNGNAPSYVFFTEYDMQPYGYHVDVTIVEDSENTQMRGYAVRLVHDAE